MDEQRTTDWTYWEDDTRSRSTQHDHSWLQQPPTKGQEAEEKNVKRLIPTIKYIF